MYKRDSSIKKAVNKQKKKTRTQLFTVRGWWSGGKNPTSGGQWSLEMSLQHLAIFSSFQ